MSIEKAQVETALAEVVDQNMEANLVATGSVKEILVDGGKITINLLLGYPAAGYFDTLKQEVKEKLVAMDGVTETTVNVASKVKSHAVQQNLKPLQGVKNIIAIASGKGGVGKSTTAVNLALALQAEGATAGILDADIYGPSIPRMLGCSGQPESVDGKSLEPMIGHGIQSMSIGYLVEEDTPMIWRGPMVTQALEQLLNDTNWKDVDYLIVDLPPGTGDTQLTLAQKIPVSGAVIVTTPQDIALLDARKGLKMFEKVEVPVLGIVENMSIHICSECGHSEHIFGEGGGAQMAEQHEVGFLGSLPLDIRIREQADSGNPTVVAMQDSQISNIYRAIARKTVAKLATRAKDHSAAFPSIVIENN
ncbi:MAG: iron-sulfur cluster carrier protein ApbC [Gammaproteobacteria bacterium]|nr:iron-sulfur cluster carrier protein ApbC [Gammaproteobacteria bacterium]